MHPICVRELTLQHFRNIESASLQPGPGLNLITGSNGSGKTSLLEALYMLATTRSFRTSRPGSTVLHGEDNALVRGTVAWDGAAVQLAVQRSRGGEVQCRIDGEVVLHAAEMARQLPLQVIEPDSLAMVSGSPDLRRRYLDWGLFHVEQGSVALFRQFRRTLLQRNALLRRRDVAGLESWDEQFVAASLRVDAIRRSYTASLRPYITREIQSITDLGDLTAEYRSGWPQEADLATLLREHRDSELKMGHSLYGPQRADLHLSYRRRGVSDGLSRGQQKLVAYGLLLAQAVLVSERGGRQAVFLVDDLLAELDQTHAQATLARLEAAGGQVFVTGVDREGLERCLSTTDYAVFHVEQGHIRQNSNPDVPRPAPAS